MKILVVCLGNICRSPMAEGIISKMARESGLEWEVDSAGTSGWHVGEAPDRRAIRTCQQNGIDISGQRSRQFNKSDFQHFDMILTMDDSNYRDVINRAPDEIARNKVKRIMDFSTNPAGEVPDPYYDGRFGEVFDILTGVASSVVSQFRKAQSS